MKRLAIALLIVATLISVAYASAANLEVFGGIIQEWRHEGDDLNLPEPEPEIAELLLAIQPEIRQEQADCEGEEGTITAQVANPAGAEPVSGLSVELWFAHEDSPDDAAQISAVDVPDLDAQQGVKVTFKAAAGTGLYWLRLVIPGEEGEEPTDVWTEAIRFDADECAPTEEDITPTEEVTETVEATEEATEAVEPTEDVTETPEPPGEATEEATETATEEATDDPGDPTEESTDEATDEPTDEPTEEVTETPEPSDTPEPADEPTEESTEEPTDEPTEEPTSEATEEPTDEPAE
jgi:hypothetical protein